MTSDRGVPVERRRGPEMNTHGSHRLLLDVAMSSSPLSAHVRASRTYRDGVPSCYKSQR